MIVRCLNCNKYENQRLAVYSEDHDGWICRVCASAKEEVVPDGATKG